MAKGTTGKTGVAWMTLTVEISDSGRLGQVLGRHDHRGGAGDGELTALFPKPPSLMTQKVRDWPDGQLFHRPMRGQNSMPSHARQVDAVERAVQPPRTGRGLVWLLGLPEARPVGLVPGQPLQVAVAQLRPACGKGQKVSVLQPLLAGDSLGGGVHAGAALVRVVGGLSQQRLVKVLQHGVQPVAKVALVHFGIQFVGLAQTQLALCKEAVRTMAQVGIRGGRQVRHRQRLAHGLGTQCGGGGHCTGRTVVRAGCSGAIQLQGQHQGAGQ